MRHTMKKCQIQTQVFVYILSMIIIALILLYGYNAIKGFKARQEQITEIELENQLKALINSASPKYGSIEKGELAMPSDYNIICFVDNSEFGVDAINCQRLTGDSSRIVNDAVKAGTANIFLVPDGSKNFKIGNIRVDAGCICIPKAGSNAVFRVEGLGSGVKISNW